VKGTIYGNRLPRGTPSEKRLETIVLHVSALSKSHCAQMTSSFGTQYKAFISVLRRVGLLVGDGQVVQDSGHVVSAESSGMAS
jgi:hypothetical protein